MKCPRCRTLCTKAELQPAIYEKTQRMIVDGEGNFIAPTVAEAKGIVGREVWTRREVSKKEICSACIAELRYGKAAHCPAVNGALTAVLADQWVHTVICPRTMR